jgi:DNA uptake protein ComE-like DNA-binding protein
MDMWRKKFLPYFLFTRKERRGIYVLLAIITAMWMIPYFFSSPVSDLTMEELKQIAVVRDSFAAREKPKDNRYPDNLNKQRPENGSQNAVDHSRYTFSPESLFFFDPNTATADQWKELGLPEKTIGTMLKYLSRGGRIRKPEDLQKIYGFPPEAYEKLKPYIRLPENGRSFAGSGKKMESWERDKPRVYKIKSNDVGRVLINQSDSLAWEALPGIGPRLAARIVGFRAKLGGFISIEQVGETFGLPDSVFQKIMPFLVDDHQNMLAKIDLNQATLEELQAHPYITYQLAKVIIAYRNQHGGYRDISDIRKIALMTPDLFNKLEPYLEAY